MRAVTTIDQEVATTWLRNTSAYGFEEATFAQGGQSTSTGKEGIGILEHNIPRFYQVIPGITPCYHVFLTHNRIQFFPSNDLTLMLNTLGSWEFKFP